MYTKRAGVPTRNHFFVVSFKELACVLIKKYAALARVEKFVSP